MNRSSSLKFLLFILMACSSESGSGSASPPQADQRIEDLEPLDLSFPQLDAQMDGALIEDLELLNELSADLTFPEEPSVDLALSEDLAPPLSLDEDEDGLSRAEELELGTDPARADSDGDGIEDGRELEEGSDPLKISSASAWFPERLSGRPRLFFGPEDREHLQLQMERLPALADRLRARATQAIEQEAARYDRQLSARRAQILEARAFLAFLEADLQAVEEIAQALSEPFPDPGNLDPYSKYDLSESESLISLCTAFDLIAGMSSDVQRGAIEESLHARLDLFSRLCLRGSVAPMVSLSRNNHAMKVQSALGLCALTLNDRPQRVRDLHEGVTGLDHLLREIQGQPSGAYAEGWNYLVYGGNSTLPFLLAYHRFAQGETMSYRALGESIIPFEGRGRLREVPDLITTPEVRRLFEMALYALRPDGKVPPTDDANPVYLPGGLLSGLFEDPRYLWRWAEGGYTASHLEIPTLALWEPAEIEADWPLDLFYPEAGWALLRTGHDPLAHHFMVQGEHGPPRLYGFGHEQADGGSFQLYAYGSPLLIDPGYISWDERRRVSEPRHHNLILVDGEGAPRPHPLDIGADAFLEAWELDPEFSSFKVRLRYRGAEIQRRFLRLQGRFYLLFDQIQAEEPHLYSLLIHGLGEISEGSFEPLERGARWDPGPAQVEVLILPLEGEARYELSSADHQVGGGRWAQHSVLEVHSERRASMGFLSLLMPLEANAERPDLSVEGRQIFFEGLKIRAEPGRGLEIWRGGELLRTWE